MLYLHSFVNYAFDLEWQYQWEQRQFVRNSLRINTGSVASDELLTDIDINISQPLNEKWRFAGRFTRDGFRWQQLRKEATSQRAIAAGPGALDSRLIRRLPDDKPGVQQGIHRYRGWVYLLHGQPRAVRAHWRAVRGLPVEYQNRFRRPAGQRPGLRGVGNWLYSDGKVGTGFERTFADATLSPEISRHNRRENTAQLRLTQAAQTGRTWSAWIRWYDFNELQEFRPPGYDYDYSDTVINAAVEHTRLIGERHRLRLLAQFVDQQAESIGFNAHNYDRQDLLAGVFYEYLWPMSGLTLAYMAGQPDIVYAAPVPGDSYELGNYRDKVMVGWRYTFSADAQIRLSISHEVAAQGFGGGAIQFQMFF
jgi:hypothetical protein